MVSGIYTIIHRDSGRWYVGQSQDIGVRLSTHRTRLKSGTHHNAKLQRAWDKYGEDAFSFEVMILAPVWMLDDLEQAYLDDPETSHFNIAKDSIAPARGGKHTPESLARMRVAQKGHAVSQDTRDRISEAHRGRKMPPRSKETRAKISEAARTRYQDPVNRAKMSEALRGRVITDSARAKMSAAQRKRYEDPKERAKTGDRSRGKKATAETIAKRVATFAAKRKSK